MKQTPKRATEVETWEDTIAMLRAGAPPSQVLPNIRTLLRGLPDASSSGPSPEPKTPTSRLYHSINGYLFQIPYLRPPPHLWRLLAEPNNDLSTRLFDGELHIDILELFQPRFVQPPPEDVRDELRKSECHNETLVIDSQQPSQKRTWTEVEIRKFGDKLASLKAGVPPGFPSLSEEDWAYIISVSNFPLEMAFVSDAVRTINQPEFSRVVLASVLPALISEADTEAFLEVVSIVVSLGELDEVPASKVTAILTRYDNLGALGAIAQVHIVCRENCTV